MEDAPRSVEDDDDDQSESSSQKRRRAGIVAHVALNREQPKVEAPKEPKAEKSDAEAKDWWQGLGAEAKPEDQAMVEALAEPVSKEEAPLKGMTAEEEQHVAQEIVAQLPAIEADPEQAETDAEAAADLADEIYRSEIEEGKTPAEAEATVETIITEATPEAETEVAAETADVEEAAEPDEASPVEFGDEALELRTPDTAADEEDEPSATTTAAPLIVPPASPPTVVAGAGIPPAGRPGPGFAPGALPPTPAVAPPSPATSPLERQRYEPDYAPQNAAGAFLLGGILGYLLGRRRGRIKTEKKLLPVQKKLEKQVEDLQWDVLERQQKIRRLAAEKVQAEGAVIVERLREQRPAKAERRSAPEATQLHSPRRPEHIGKVLIAETPNQQGPEVVASKVSVEHRVETLSRPELLELASKISVEGTNLRTIYETHLINERGLRHLVAEHLQGRDIKHLLSRELSDRQRDFERDPLQRDNFAPVQASNVGSTTLQSLIEQNDHLGDDGQQSRDAQLEFQAQSEGKQQVKRQQRRRLADLSMVIIILILLAFVIVLFLSRQ